MNTSVYFDTWGAPWVSDASQSDLAKMQVNVVNLAFANPGMHYTKGQFNFDGTGLQFSWDFQVVKQAILLLKQKSTKVMLSVGGASYSFDYYNVQNVVALAVDLGCDGIDIDWEPTSYKPDQLRDILILTRQHCKGLLSFAGWSTGCFDPVGGDLYRGLNIQAIKDCSEIISWINIMAYDAGKDFDVKASYDSYKKYFKKQVYVGFQVGPQGWGDALLTLEDVDKTCNFILPGDGCFVWSWYKQGKPTCYQVLTRIKQGLWNNIPQVPPVKFSFKCTCSNCGKSLEFNG